MGGRVVATVDGGIKGGSMFAKKILTLEEIAQYCRVDATTVERWIERGQLKKFAYPEHLGTRVEAQEFLSFLRNFKRQLPAEIQRSSTRVLVVEDDLEMAHAIQRVLHRAGFQCAFAQDGFRAGVSLGNFLPTIVTLDLNMPALGGEGVLKFIRETEYLRDVKILVISAASEDALAKARRLGADDVLSKPFENDELLVKIRALADIEFS